MASGTVIKKPNAHLTCTTHMHYDVGMNGAHVQNTTQPTTRQEKSQVMTVDQVLRELGGAVGRSSIYKALKLGLLPSRRLGRRILISRARFEAWLEGEPQPGAKAGHDRG
ncbi:MAG: helix-turn-helix domain-containing protein [Halothiobacillaceae bacterium]